MKTEIFEDYEAFLARTDKSVNGVSPEFSAANPDYEQDNETNRRCWNCKGCRYCVNCHDSSALSFCYHCHECINMMYCELCMSSSGLRFCHECQRCENCQFCQKCRHIKDAKGVFNKFHIIEPKG